MRDLHPNLGANATGLRKKVYAAALAATVVVGAGTILGVGLGLIPPTPTDIYLSWAFLLLLFVPFIALHDNLGEKRTRVEMWSEFGFCWLLVSGIAQTFWELPWFFLDFFGLIQGATEDDRWLWAWWVYGGADTRYLSSNPTIAGLEFMAGLSGPIELYGWWLYTHSKTIKEKITASWIALIIGVGLTYQTGVFFIAEWHIGWIHIQQGAAGFWLKFVGLNVPWIVAPILSLPAAVYEIAHWYRVEGYEAAQRDLRPERRIAVREPQAMRRVLDSVAHIK
jgi:hypothetical protein